MTFIGPIRPGGDVALLEQHAVLVAGSPCDLISSRRSSTTTTTSNACPSFVARQRFAEQPFGFVSHRAALRSAATWVPTAERAIDEVCEEPGTAAVFSSRRVERAAARHTNQPPRAPSTENLRHLRAIPPRHSHGLRAVLTELQRHSSTLTLCRSSDDSRAQNHGAERQRAKPPRRAPNGASASGDVSHIIAAIVGPERHQSPD